MSVAVLTGWAVFVLCVDSMDCICVAVLTGWAVRVHPVCLLQHLLPQLLVELRQVPGPCRANASLPLDD